MEDGGAKYGQKFPFYFMSLCLSRICLFSVEATLSSLLPTQLVLPVIAACPMQDFHLWHQVLLGSVVWIPHCSIFLCFRNEVTASSFSNRKLWQLKRQVGKSGFQEGERIETVSLL